MKIRYYLCIKCWWLNFRLNYVKGSPLIIKSRHLFVSAEIPRNRQQSPWKSISYILLNVNFTQKLKSTRIPLSFLWVKYIFIFCSHQFNIYWFIALQKIQAIFEFVYHMYANKNNKYRWSANCTHAPPAVVPYQSHVCRSAIFIKIELVNGRMHSFWLKCTGK